MKKHRRMANQKIREDAKSRKGIYRYNPPSWLINASELQNVPGAKSRETELELRKRELDLWERELDIEEGKLALKNRELKLKESHLRLEWAKLFADQLPRWGWLAFLLLILIF